MPDRDFIRRTVACPLLVLSLAWVCAAPASAAPRTLTSDNVVFGGRELPKAVPLPGGGKFTTLLTIPDVKLPSVKEARSMTSAAVSAKNSGGGKAVVRLRLVVNGVPTGGVFSSTLAPGSSSTISLLRNGTLTSDQSDTYALQAAVVGSRQRHGRDGHVRSRGHPDPADTDPVRRATMAASSTYRLVACQSWRCRPRGRRHPRVPRDGP